MPWYCPAKPEVVLSEAGQDVTEYTFQCDFPEIDGKRIESEVLKLGRNDVSFEMICLPGDGSVVGCATHTGVRVNMDTPLQRRKPFPRPSPREQVL